MALFPPCRLWQGALQGIRHTFSAEITGHFSALPSVAMCQQALTEWSCSCVCACAQTVEDISKIMQEARTPPAGPAGWENDEYIDDAMDQEAYESSFDEWGMGTSM